MQSRCCFLCLFLYTSAPRWLVDCRWSRRRAAVGLHASSRFLRSGLRGASEVEAEVRQITGGNRVRVILSGILNSLYPRLYTTHNCLLAKASVAHVLRGFL